MNSCSKKLIFASVLILTFSLVAWAGQNGQNWDYSLGSKYGKSAYTPLKKIESEVLYYPYIGEQDPVVGSPMGSDFHTYILPASIFGIETLELEFREGELEIKGDIVEIERLVRELEEAIPLVLEDALKRQEEGLEEYKYGLKIKVAKNSSKKVNNITDEEQDEQHAQQERKPEEYEVDILVNIIFGQNKIIIKLPPLKDPKDKERLIKELERIAHILARQDDLIDIIRISD